jgi:hypothetical protein
MALDSIQDQLRFDFGTGFVDTQRRPLTDEEALLH